MILPQKETNTFSFEKLEVWQLTKDWVVDTYKMTNQLPRSEKFGLINQIRRASVSVSSNIVEGNYRLTNPDKKKFFSYSYSSIMEVFSQILIANGLEYLPDTSVNYQRKKVTEISRKINSLYRSFDR